MEAGILVQNPVKWEAMIMCVHKSFVLFVLWSKPCGSKPWPGWVFVSQKWNSRNLTSRASFASRQSQGDFSLRWLSSLVVCEFVFSFPLFFPPSFSFIPTMPSSLRDLPSKCFIVNHRNLLDDWHGDGSLDQREDLALFFPSFFRLLLLDSPLCLYLLSTLHVSSMEYWLQWDDGCFFAGGRGGKRDEEWGSMLCLHVPPM